MSRLDKQLANLSGETLIRVEWVDDSLVDPGELRTKLRKEIDAREHRIPLDLRRVRGAPEALVEILVDMRRYATSVGKQLSITGNLPELRDAIDERLHRPVGLSAKPSSSAEDGAAPELAKQVLQSAKKTTDEYDLSHATKIKRRKKRSSKRRRVKRLTALIAVSSLVVAVCVFVYIWYLEDETFIVEPPRKGFESLLR
ncbi:MAG: hypothetical protein AAGJ83_01135 [Planctomycetota bacterium]